ncbi:MAG: helix-turn-helix domain-containing protein [Oscillospiraceae bacterium]|nr:helix-turn-helix domain-containing protein [Oscillospiraceae bacterium]
MKEQLQSLRKAKGLTQEEMAQSIGVSLSTYQKYERDVISPPYDTLLKIADFYDVTTDYLLGRKTFQDPINLLNLNPLEKSIVYAYIGLSSEKRTELVEIIRQIANGSDLQLVTKKPEIQQSTSTSPLTYVGTVGEELERRKHEEEALEKGTG